MLAPAHVLVVDDELELRRVLEIALSTRGYVVKTAADGDEAIALLGAAEFDAVLTDILMPRATGLDVLRAARELTPRAQVIVVTGVNEFETAVECLRAGAVDLVRKPINLVELVAAVERAVERRRLLAATALYQASQAIFATREPQCLPEVIVEVSKRVMGADDVSLMLPDAGGRLQVAHSHALPPGSIAQASTEVAERVAAMGAPRLLLGTLADDPEFRGITSYGRVQASIVYPLLSGQRLVGVLNINRVSGLRPFRQADLELASVLASQVLLALENTRLLRQMIDRERLASLGQLAAVVAHEINNPLVAVLINLSRVDDALEGAGPPGADLEEASSRAALEAWWHQIGGRKGLDDLRLAVADALFGADRIQQITRDVLGISRPSDGRMDPFDINDALRAGIRLARPRIVQAGVDLQTEFGPAIRVVGHSGRLSQVFVNLLVNACHAVQASKPQRRIIVQSRREGDQVVVDIADNGIGIAPEHLSRIFDPFFTTKEAVAGTGLGLFVSQEIVRQHGGEIRVRSVLGSGTTFAILVPVEPRLPDLAPRPPDE